VRSHIGPAAPEFVPKPVVDIQECYGGIEKGLIKHLIKDAERDEQRNLVFDDEFRACVYEGIEGIRMVQTSRGFWVECESARAHVLNAAAFACAASWK
jgi:hypothetical protein